MSSGECIEGVIRLLRRLLNDAATVKGTEKDGGEEVGCIENVREEKSGLRPYFEARCRSFLDKNGCYHVPTEQYLPFIFKGVMHNGKEYPLVSGEYKSLDQLMNFHLSLEKYGFNVEPEWTHHVDGSIELENPF